MILKLIFLCLLSLGKCLEEKPHACLNVTSSQYYCCSDFEEKDGKCVGCETGFTSDVGQPCRECSKKFYGKRCISECKCKDNEKCHHIHGCIGDGYFLEPTTTNSISDLNKGSAYPTICDPTEHIHGSCLEYPYCSHVTTTLMVHTVSYLTPTEQTSDRSESVTVYEPIISGSTESTGPHNGFQLELLIYSASVTGFILILGICCLCKKYNTRRKKSSASVTLDEEVNQNDPPNESHETIELSEGLYHTIDEDKISVSSINDNPYLEVVNGSSGSDSIKNDNGETTSYPPPYCRQITTSIDKHQYENSRPESFESHDQISGIQETDQDYLTPSKPTIDSSIKCETEIFAMVHVETYSSSGSENEKFEKNDGIDYLNPYQPLEKNNLSEKDHGYEIPLNSPAKLTLDNVDGQPVEQLSKFEKNNTETL